MPNLDKFVEKQDRIDLATIVYFHSNLSKTPWIQKVMNSNKKQKGNFIMDLLWLKKLECIKSP